MLLIAKIIVTFSSFFFFFHVYAEDVEVITVKRPKDNYFQFTNPGQESMDEDELKRKSLFFAEEIWDQFSNLNTSSGSNRIRYVKIRGIGERSEYDTVPSNSVGVFYDHMDLSGLSGIIATYDVENIEVLKGPQTFLYGDSSLGGNILFQSSTTIENKTSFWVDGGSQHHRIVGAKGNYLLGESSSIKIGAQKNNSDGFYYNKYFGEHTSERDELFASFGTQFNFGRSILTTSHILAEQKNGNDVWNTDGGFQTYSDKMGKDNQFTHGHSLEWNSLLAADFRYLAIASYTYSDIINSYDEDWNNNTYWNSVAGWNKNYDYYKHYNRKKYNLHTKLIFQNVIDKMTISYGLHYYQKKEVTDIDSYRNALLRSHLNSKFVADKIAVLMNLAYSFTPTLKFDFSARGEKQFIDYEDSDSFKSELENESFAFNASLIQHAGNNTFRALVSRGFKGAGFNPDINLKPEQQSYGPEHAMNYEMSWLYQNYAYSQNLTVFYLDRRDHQITTSTQDDPTDPSEFTFFIDNAARSSHYGLEWDAELFTQSPVSIDLSLGLLKAKFEDYSLENKSYDGRDLAHSPHYTYSVGLNWKILKRLIYNINATGKDRFYFSNTHDEQSESYVLLHTNIQYQILESLKMTVWVRNLLDQTYSQRGFYFANEPPNWSPRLYTQNGTPREWGLRISYTF